MVYPILISDLSNTLILAKDKTHKGSLNALHQELLADDEEYHFWDYFDINKELLKLYIKLTNSMHMYILTTGHIQEHPALKNIFDPIFSQIFVSSDMNLNKSEVLIYKTLASKLKTNPNNIIYIDDSYKNIQAAKLAHFHAIQHNSQTQSIKEIKALVNMLEH